MSKMPPKTPLIYEHVQVHVYLNNYLCNSKQCYSFLTIINELSYLETQFRP